ncbi:MAG: DNA replication and repair protein RecF, partial [Candidatus Limnocylindria bacterium]|nr:DNA replication and repair protein RecF [Candidatus Limnocylindria bacterium]
MRVRHLALEEFRSYDRAEIALAPGITAFVGANGAGKTNLLEAIHLAARGDSARARDDAEMVHWGAAVGRVRVEVERAEDMRRVEVVLFAPAALERRRPRRWLLDGAGKRADDALGELKVVAFFPEDVALLAEAPAARRRYLDAMIGQVDRRHRADTREYQRVLEQRNALLRALRDSGASAGEARRSAELAFWNESLCALGGTIAERRALAVHEIGPAFARAIATFTGGGTLELTYASQIEGASAEERSAGYRRLVEEKGEREIWQGTTLVGPHREDLAMSGGGRPLPAFASRGEHRSAVLSLKLAEADWLRERSGEEPIFLLDDVLSELDPRRREALVGALPSDAQVL